MKKKILLTIFILLLSATFFTKSAYAFGLDTNIFDSISGVSCGVANTPNNKCCALAYVKFDRTFGKNEIDWPLAPVLVPVEIIVNGLWGTITTNVSDVSNKLVGRKGVCLPGSEPSTIDTQDLSCKCVATDTTSTLNAIANLCNNIGEASEKEACRNCLNADVKNQKAGVWTGLGCIYGDMPTFIEKNVLGFGISLAGAVALLCIIYAAFRLQVSRANPEGIKKAQEMLTSCIMGLLLIIFAVFILRIIGVDILRIPGFN